MCQSAAMGSLPARSRGAARCRFDGGDEGCRLVQHRLVWAGTLLEREILRTARLEKVTPYSFGSIWIFVVDNGS